MSDPSATPWTVACQAPLSMGFSMPGSFHMVAAYRDALVGVGGLPVHSNKKKKKREKETVEGRRWGVDIMVGGRQMSRAALL